MSKIVRHFKGKLYKIVCVAVHTETKEELIIYKNMEGSETYARPKFMFWEFLEIDGKAIRRFERLNHEQT
jgi:hypothetical protein